MIASDSHVLSVCLCLCFKAHCIVCSGLQAQQCAVLLLLSYAEANAMLQTQVVELLQAGRSKA